LPVFVANFKNILPPNVSSCFEGPPVPGSVPYMPMSLHHTSLQYKVLSYVLHVFYLLHTIFLYIAVKPLSIRFIQNFSQT